MQRVVCLAQGTDGAETIDSGLRRDVRGGDSISTGEIRDDESELPGHS